MSAKFRKHYGKYIATMWICFIIFVILSNGKNILLPINDNLDSNISLAKMYHDNNMWVDRETPVPFLGGISREILTCGYSLSSLLDCFFSIDTAYAIRYVLHIFFSVSGFYYIALVLNKYGNYNFDKELFVVFGLFYSMLGVWPPHWVSFSLLPWWGAILYELFITKKIVLLIPLFFLMVNTSLPLLGIFICFYLCLGWCVICYQKKYIDAKLLGLIISILGVYGILEGHILSLGFLSKIETIKSLNNKLYTESFAGAIKNVYYAVFNHNKWYHSGLCSISPLVTPVAGYVLSLYYDDGLLYKRYYLIRILFICIFFHFIIASFDNCSMRSFLIPMLAGFSFSRFIWLSPFFFILSLAILCDSLKLMKKKVACFIVAIAIPFLIIFENYSSITYNLLAINTRAIISHTTPEKASYSTWSDFYQEEMFAIIKHDISYNKEWSVGYFLDPAVLQYNGIHTLDGYYSNYSVEYKNVWQKVISPVFELQEASLHKDYWNSSNGIRAYIYSSGYKTLYDFENIKEYPFEANIHQLKALQCKYIFSRVKISNYQELALSCVGKWESDDDYIVYVYKIN